MDEEFAGLALEARAAPSATLPSCLKRPLTRAWLLGALLAFGHGGVEGQELDPHAARPLFEAGGVRVSFQGSYLRSLGYRPSTKTIILVVQEIGIVEADPKTLEFKQVLRSTELLKLLPHSGVVRVCRDGKEVHVLDESQHCSVFDSATGDLISTTEISPDSFRIPVTVSASGAFSVWKSAEHELFVYRGETLQEGSFRWEKSRILAVVSPDEKLIAVSSEHGKSALLDATTLAPVSAALGSFKGGELLAFDDTSTRLATFGFDHSLSVVDLVHPEAEPRRFPVGRARGGSLRFFENSVLFCAGNGTIQSLDLSSGKINGEAQGFGKEAWTWPTPGLDQSYWKGDQGVLLVLPVPLSAPTEALAREIRCLDATLDSGGRHLWVRSGGDDLTVFELSAPEKPGRKTPDPTVGMKLFNAGPEAACFVDNKAQFIRVDRKTLQRRVLAEPPGGISKGLLTLGEKAFYISTDGRLIRMGLGQEAEVEVMLNGIAEFDSLIPVSDSEIAICNALEARIYDLASRKITESFKFDAGTRFLGRDPAHHGDWLCLQDRSLIRIAHASGELIPLKSSLSAVPALVLMDPSSGIVAWSDREGGRAHLQLAGSARSIVLSPAGNAVKRLQFQGGRFMVLYENETVHVWDCKELLKRLR